MGLLLVKDWKLIGQSQLATHFFLGPLLILPHPYSSGSCCDSAYLLTLMWTPLMVLVQLGSHFEVLKEARGFQSGLFTAFQAYSHSNLLPSLPRIFGSRGTRIISKIKWQLKFQATAVYLGQMWVFKEIPLINMYVLKQVSDLFGCTCSLKIIII